MLRSVFFTCCRINKLTHPSVFSIGQRRSIRRKRRGPNEGLQNLMVALQVDAEDNSGQLPEDVDLESQNFDSVLENKGTIWDEPEIEMKKQKSYDRKKLLEKRFFRPEKEPTMLTYSARTQILYLHQRDPEIWTPRKIAESFPISVQGAKKVLRSKISHYSEDEILKHDKRVTENWKMLKSANQSSSDEKIALWQQHKLNYDNYAGNNLLPMPDPNFQKKSVVPSKRGEFSKLLPVTDGVPVQPVTRSEEQTKFEKDELLAGTTYDGVSSRKATLRTAAEFERGVKIRESKSVFDVEYKKWMLGKIKEAKSDSTPKIRELDERDGSEENVKKYVDDELMEFKIDYRKDSRRKDVYLYHREKGYQKPFGDIIPNKIHVPKSLKKRDAIYRVDNSYYDANGELLYRVPVYDR